MIGGRLAGSTRPVRGGDQVRQRHEGHQRPRLRRPWRRGATSDVPSSRRCGGCAPTGSTSTSSTSPTRSRRWRRPCRCSPTSFARARSATSAAPTSPAGRSPTPTGSPAPPASSASSPLRTSYSLLDRSRRGGRRARGRALRARRAAVLPAGVRPAHRQVPPRPGGAVRLARPVRAGDRGSRTPTGTGSRRWRSTPRRATLSMLDVAIGGLAAQPTVASVISGATSGDQVRANAGCVALAADRRRPRRARRAHPAPDPSQVPGRRASWPSVPASNSSRVCLAVIECRS